MKLSREARLAKWADDLRQAEESGLTKKEWCRIHGITENTFYYRMKVLNDEYKIRKSSQLSRVDFVQVPTAGNDALSPASLPASGNIVIELINAKITMASDCNLQQLKTVLEVLKNA